MFKAENITVVQVDRAPARVRDAQVAPVKRAKLGYIQSLRSIAIFLVIVAHCRDSFSADDVVRSSYVDLFTTHINIIFIFVSGFLFQFLLGRFEYRKYLTTKVRNVLLPYVLVSVPAILIYLLGFKPIEKLGAPGWIDNPVEFASYMLLTGSHLAPFWFIPMMCVFYLLAPLFRWIDRNPAFYGLIIPFLAISMVIGRSPHDQPLWNAAFYVPIYVLGMCVSHFRETLSPIFARFWPLLLACIFLPELWSGSFFVYSNLLLVSKILVCFGIIGLLIRYDAVIPAWFHYLGDISFGIFFVHYYIVASVTMLAAHGKLPFLNGLDIYLALIILVTALSVATVAAIKRVTGAYSRQVIGA